MPFRIDPKLIQDSHMLGKNGNIHLLLNRNALYPWFILVPETEVIELYKLAPALQSELLSLINTLSPFVEKQFRVDKLNVATIGNVVSQLHVHVIGRRRNDPCWPGVVWGRDQFEAYTPDSLAQITNQLHKEQLCASS